ncbi:CU044_5270 family protein [Streptomyces sp. NPDC001544]|uniref:CU044_5270 family protein n=1 Tax=Streptomyces sp. NPDC001544 TaxID=3364584 RepID=UPI0036A98040
MNADDLPRAGSGSAARSEAEELLSAPAEWDLPRNRHLHHKDVLMRRIDHDLNPAARTAAAPPRRKLLLRAAVLLPAASLALAGALVVTLSGGGGSAPGSGTGGAGTAEGGPSASVTLGRIAAAAMETGTSPVKDGQLVYVRTLLRANTGTFEGPVKLGALHQSESWTVQNPAPVKTAGWLRETGKDAVMPGETIPIEEGGAPVPAGFDRPTYKWLASLPTDPAALLRLIYSRTKGDETESHDQAAFSRIGDLLGDVMPAANNAALYKAAARIPGVVVIPDAVDAAGRHGIGITREDPRSRIRDVWIFDKHDLTYLGARSYITKDKKKEPRPTTLLGVSAVMERAVVDHRGDTPGRANG